MRNAEVGKPYELKARDEGRWGMDEKRINTIRIIEGSVVYHKVF
jgi:hypothetical protein